MQRDMKIRRRDMGRGRQGREKQADRETGKEWEEAGIEADRQRRRQADMEAGGQVSR